MTLTVGTTAPNFSVKDTSGKTVTLSDYQGQNVVLYFYPKDDTPGCTKEACSFRDNYTAYQGKAIVVLGVSVDDEASHQLFTQKFNLPFPLLADTNAFITKAYDVETYKNDVLYAKRVTYVIDPSGKISHVFDSINTETHAQDILSALGL
jgi:thioredoxin-dependent peroxiredoxin